MRLMLRKPERLELPVINMIKERRTNEHYLLLLSEEGGIKVSIDRNRREIVNDRIDRRNILERLKISPNMPERPTCASIPPEKGCRPDTSRERLDKSTIETILNTDRRWVDIQDFLSAALFEASDGYLLLVSINTDERKERRVEFIEAERLVGISVLGEIHSYDPISGNIVKLPDLTPVAEIGTIEDEPIAFTDDENEALIIGDQGIRAERVHFRISETHQRVRGCGSHHYFTS